MKSSYVDTIDKEFIYIDMYTHSNMALHKHDFLELAYIVDGRAVHTRDDVRTEVVAGDYFIIDYNSYHMYEAEKQIKLINCLFLPEFIDGTLVGCNSFTAVLNNYLIRFDCGIRENINSIFHDDDGKIKQLMDKLMREFDAKNPGYLELMRCTLVEIIINMMRSAATADSHASYRPQTKYIMSYVNKYYGKDISLSAIAAELHYTVSHLSHTFREDTGMGFNAYLQKIRLEHACRLLANTNKKIFEIAEVVGVCDADYFRELFKRHFGINPADFRKNFK